MIGQIVFGVWCMQELAAVGTWEDALLINWFHLIKILMNLFVIQSFVKRIKAKQPSGPLGYLSSYITLLIYLSFLFVYAGDLSPNIDIIHLKLLWVYAATDTVMLLFSWGVQRNVIARRNHLFTFSSYGVTQEKKDDDLFDIRYLPEEYMSDI